MPYRLVEAWNKKQAELNEAASTQFKIVVGRLKGIYGNDEVPTHDQLVKDATLAAGIYKISDVKGFVKFVETQIKTKDGLKESVELDEASWADARLASVDVKKILERQGFKIYQVSQNGFRMVHEKTGCIGNVVFDPTLPAPKQ